MEIRAGNVLFGGWWVVFEQVRVNGNVTGGENLAWSCPRQMAYKTDGTYTTTES